jgi:hypothetical protein
MNAIQIGYAIDFYTNLTHASRFYNIEKNKAMNDAIMKKIDSITDTINSNQLTGIDRIQKYRDELYTLLKTSSTAPTNIGTYNTDVYINHVDYPIDYQTFAALTLTVGGNTTYGRETTYNKRGPLLECSFRKPTNKKPYFLEDSTGLLIYKGDSSAITSCKLDYIKQPAVFNMGDESQYINAGVGVVTIGASYIATELSVQNGVTYQIGTQFTAAVTTTLASGQVILASNTTTTDMPEKCQDELAKLAASILLGVTSAFENSAFAEKETK